MWKDLRQHSELKINVIMITNSIAAETSEAIARAWIVLKPVKY